ncbi:hypothetical protein BJX65DRAFT_314055 [Aspergillus insuetus]
MHRSHTVPTPAPVPDDVGSEVNPRCGLYHDIGAGDDCSTIGLRYNIPLQDFLFLNPNVWENCTNLWLDYSYYVQAVGTLPRPSTSIPWSAIPTRESLMVIPLANETRIDCWNYLWINNTDSEWLNCWGYALAAGLSRAQFALWNPSIDQNAKDADAPSYDKPTASAPPAPVLVERLKDASCGWRSATETTAAVSFPTWRWIWPCFIKMNPSVKENCSGLSLGTNYCISTDEIGLIDPGG